jgi:hypothetical protein
VLAVPADSGYLGRCCSLSYRLASENKKHVALFNNDHAALALPDGFLASKRRQPDGPCFYRLGRRTVRYRRSEVIRWIDACERATCRVVSAASAGAPA